MILQKKLFKTCHGCKTTFPVLDENFLYIEGSDSNRYGVASPECVALFYTVLIKEQEWASYPPIHRLLIDSYAVQHPPHHDKQKKFGISQRLIDASIQSIAIHLIALYLALEKKIPLRDIAKYMDRFLATGVKLEMVELEPPYLLGNITIIDIQKVSNFDEYEKLVWLWAHEVWQAWNKHHQTIRELFKKYAP